MSSSLEKANFKFDARNVGNTMGKRPMGKMLVYQCDTYPFFQLHFLIIWGIKKIVGVLKRESAELHFNCFVVHGHCLIHLFVMPHTFSVGDRSLLQTGQSNTHTLYL